MEAFDDIGLGKAQEKASKLPRSSAGCQSI
jgi:hypothetical protein